jgi:exosortase/archaeosortase
MKKALSTITQVVGVVTLIGIGYVVLNALPDLKRYIRISSM